MSTAADSPSSRAAQRRSFEIDSDPEGPLSQPLLAQAREAMAANDLKAFAAACQRWLRMTHGLAIGEGVLLQVDEQPLEMLVEDVALIWKEGDATSEPLLLLYGLTVHDDGERVARQWNRVRHDAGLEKLARPSDVLIGYLAHDRAPAPTAQENTVRVFA